MIKQIIFLISLLVTLGVFFYTVRRIYNFLKLTKPFPIKDYGKRFKLMMEVAIGQTKILRFPFVGILHALVFWGFLVILIGSIEMVIDGLFRTERVMSSLGIVYDIIIASGDIFAFVIAIAILVFLGRRLLIKVNRFEGIEMKHKSHMDANIALTLILLLMISLLGMNTYYLILHPDNHVGYFPVSMLIVNEFIPLHSINYNTAHFLHEFYWWTHILLIFLFANILPYSKHFHVFLSVPNVFLARLEPLGVLYNMPEITQEVKLMMNPDTAFAAPAETDAPPARFGVKDVEDITWKNYLDSLTCTECGRCTSVCPANITGKKLSPRKIIMDVRARMKEKGPGLLKVGKDFDDQKALINENYITPEELWACTTCNACAQECPVNINHPSIIVDMRRYLVMEESAAPGELNAMFSNIENNGAPWQFSPEDRMLWAEGLEVPLMADKLARGENPEFLFWVGSAGAFDDRYKKVTREFVKILNHLKIDYAVLGVEETDSGDIARRSGNEMLYQMQAMMNVEIMNGYEVKKIVTCCPHDFNTLKNEYTEFGGNYEVVHHSQFLQDLIKKGKVNISNGKFKDRKITFHDPCYLGRGNGEYDAPRDVLNAIPSEKVEMKRSKSFGLCCGAGGGQMFKEAEKGNKEVFIERTEEAIETGADIICTACPFCMTMMTDGIKYKNKEEEMKNYDIAELVSMSMDL
ncbi:MAG: 4Fe-4S dicluster domain-containing protein [Bacteroidales bacterium]|nr:4Fe-4S dicluster domain-containing protein [Bacteroidales bacterium]